MSTPSQIGVKPSAENGRDRGGLIRKASSWLSKISFSDWLMVVFTGVIAFYAYSQFREMKSAGHQTDRIIAADDRLAAAMENSVKQAQDIATETVEEARLDQRAWLGVKAIDSLQLQVGRPIRAIVHITNTGKTIALNYRPDIVLEPSKGRLDIAKWVVFPNLDIAVPLQTGGQLSPEDIENIKSHKLLIYIIGDIDYRDVFKHPHITHFCGRLDTSVAPYAYAACSSHNDAN